MTKYNLAELVAIRNHMYFLYGQRSMVAKGQLNAVNATITRLDKYFLQEAMKLEFDMEPATSTEAMSEQKKMLAELAATPLPKVPEKKGSFRRADKA